MTDVTDKVDFQNSDDESLPLTRCICNTTFPPWTESISIYPEHPWVCPTCGVKLVFRNAVRIYQVP